MESNSRGIIGTLFGKECSSRWVQGNFIRNYQDFQKDNNAHILTKGLVFEAKDSATSPTMKEDLLNKIGKKIRFRKKKREKVKTENRARKALKTISLILGAFVTCWTPYHILAIIASFCPACVNIHIYMLSYFLCYANRWMFNCINYLLTRSN